MESEEYGTVSVVPTPIFSDVCVDPTTFAAYAAQVPANLERIRAVYASLAFHKANTFDEFLR